MSACIVCDSAGVALFLDLGCTALANKFLRREELSRPEPTHPLRVGLCPDCGHVQLMEHVPPAAMFDEYLYISSMSDTLEAHLRSVADWVARRYHLGPDDLAIDIGSNDGTLLTGYRPYGVRTLGVDPARNLAPLAAENGIETFTAWFGADSAKEIVARHGQAAVVTATNSFPHIPDLGDFMRGIDMVLKPGGAVVIEAHYLVDLFDQGAFDTIYHEHVSYWALGPMTRLFDRFGMAAVRAERLPLHHGQLRVVAQRKGDGEADPTVREILELERSLGIPGREACERLAQTTRSIKAKLHRKLERLRSEGKRVAGYGAPAKGNTLLSFLEIGPEQISYIADRSPLKQGRYTPGTHIPVVAPERILEDMPDYVLLLAWNFAEEIMRQQTEYRRRGGQFILPLGDVDVL